jgi:hypothetical protein
MAWRITGPSSSRAQLPASYFIGEWRHAYSPQPKHSKGKLKKGWDIQIREKRIEISKSEIGHATALEYDSCGRYFYWRGAK